MEEAPLSSGKEFIDTTCAPAFKCIKNPPIITSECSDILKFFEKHTDKDVYFSFWASFIWTDAYPHLSQVILKKISLLINGQTKKYGKEVILAPDTFKNTKRASRGA